MDDRRSEQRLLPHLDEAPIPAVRRSRIDEWRRLHRDERVAQSRAFAADWRAGGYEAVSAHPWWDVLSNLSVARFAIDDDDS